MVAERVCQATGPLCGVHGRCGLAWLAAGLLLGLWPGVVLAQPENGHGDAPVVMEAITVTAERIDTFAQNNPHQVVVLGVDEIRERNLRNVEEALGSMAGVDVKKSSGIGSRISIRGSGKAGGVLVLLNGRPLNSSQYGGADISTIPIDIVKSITVFKPPVPVWLGAGASEGAIVITTIDQPVAEDDDDGRHVTRVRVAGGSYGRAEGTLSHRTTMTGGSIMATASGSRRDGKRTNSDRNSGNFTLHLDRELAGQRRVELDGRYYLAEYGSAGPTDNPTPDARQSYRKGAMESRFSGLFGAGGDYAFNLYGDVIDLKDESQTGLVSTLDNTKVGIKGESNWSDDADRWGVQVSGILARDDVDHTLSGTHHRTTAGLGAQVDRRWDRFSLSCGMRGDHTSDFDFNPGFSSGLRMVLAENWSIKAGAGYTVSIPTFGQLYQPSHGSIDQTRGNPDLDEERIWTYDASLEYRRGKAHLFQFTGFRSDTHDPIVYLRGDDLIYRPVNAGRSWRHGLEGTWKYRFDTGLTVDANAIVQDSEISDNGNELPYTPRIKLKLTLRCPVKPFDTRLETSLRYRSKQYSESENREVQRLDDYATVDLKILQPFAVKGIEMEGFVNFTNLFDKRFSIHYGYPDDGFRLLAGLNVTF